MVLEMLTYALCEPATIIVGALYPMYKSLQAVESTRCKDDDKMWLTYWVVYMLWSFAEFFFSALKSLIPLYYAWKLGVVCCLVAPSLNLPVHIYDWLIGPFFRANHAVIDAIFGLILKIFNALIKGDVKAAKELAEEVVDEVEEIKLETSDTAAKEE